MAIILGTPGNDNKIGTDEADTIEGLDGNDTLSGGKGNDFLFGQAGDDSLSGGIGNDKMTGGAGDDTYQIESVGDKAIEAAGGGFDTVFSAIASFTLGANVEDLNLVEGGIEGIGNSLDNGLVGNDADNKLAGQAGNDILNGGAGVDIMTGGTGHDIYLVDNINDKVIEAAGGGIDQVLALNVNFSIGESNNIENLALLGDGNINAFGNDIANKLTGGSGANLLSGGKGNDTLNGGAGADVLIGGLGDDTFIVDDAGDKTSEDAKGGKDRVLASASFTLATGQEIAVAYQGQALDLLPGG